jgi:prepilin-type processing-associated H-X9-DG protein
VKTCHFRGFPTTDGQLQKDSSASLGMTTHKGKIMSHWLKRRLIALFCAATLCGGASYLSAQNDYPAPAKTPEEASEKFYEMLSNGLEAGSVSGIFDWTQNPNLVGSVSRQQMTSLVKADAKPEALFMSMSLLMNRWVYTGRKANNEGDKSVVEVYASPKPRQVICIQEDGGWRVDLFATYGKWSNLSGVALDQEIYGFTGLITPAMRSSDGFLRSQCQSNLKPVMLAVKQYMQDYDEKMPPARRWSDVLDPYTNLRELFNCPALPTGKTNGYAFNQNLSQVSESRIKESAATVSIYETSNLGLNVFGPGTGRAYRHMDGANFAFADGHVKWFSRGNSAKLSFKP